METLVTKYKKSVKPTKKNEQKITNKAKITQVKEKKRENTIARIIKKSKLKRKEAPKRMNKI